MNIRLDLAPLEQLHRLLDAMFRVCVPTFMTIAEDMSYNHGPMISRQTFRDFLAPYYRALLPRLRKSPAVTPEELTRVEVQTIEHHLVQMEKARDESGLKDLWRHVPRRLRHDPRLARRYA